MRRSCAELVGDDRRDILRPLALLLALDEVLDEAPTPPPLWC